MEWVLSIHPTIIVTWAITWEWAFSIHPAIIATWALIREWVLTTVLLFKYQLCLLTIDVATYECGCSNLFALDLCAI